MQINKLRKIHQIPPEEFSYSGSMARFPTIINRILIVQTAFLGDLILTTPLVSSIKELFPGASLDMVIIAKIRKVLENNPNVNQVYTFFKKGKDKKRSFNDLRVTLEANNYDLGIIPHRSMTTSRLIRKSRIKFKIGYDQASFSGFFYDIQVKRRKGVHEIERHLDLLRPVVDYLKNPINSNSKKYSDLYQKETWLYPSPKNCKKAQKFINERLRPDQGTKPLVVLAPGSVYRTKKWPEENYIALIELLENSGCLTFLIGGPEDEKLCRDIVLRSKTNSVITAGRADILDSAALVQRSNLLFCNDSAPMHIANAMKTPVIAFFGATSPIFGFGPIRTNDAVLEKNDLPCHPCKMHGSKKCPQKHFKCMTGLTPSFAFQKAKEILNLE